MNNRSSRLLIVLLALSAVVYSCSSPISVTLAVSKTGNPTNTARSEPTLTPTITASPSQTPTITPTPLPLLYAKKVVAGPGRTCAITLSGGLKCWGDNSLGLLGDGTKVDRYTPTDVVGLTSGVVDVDLSRYFSCAVTDTGGAKCWGSNHSGTLGANLGPADFRLTPVDVYGLTSGVKAITTGSVHACALMENGSVKCWGDNGFGVLGNEVYYISNVPIDVLGLRSGVVAISSDSNHNCALMNTGGVKCWGSGGNSEILGSGAPGKQYPEYTVVDVKGLNKGAIAITAGDAFTCALMETSTVKCWGFNEFGVLGDGTEIDRPTPVDVIGFENPVVSISASSDYICAVISNGEVKCWGFNFLWVPNGDLPDRYTKPSSVSDFTEATSISVGIAYACAHMDNKSILCWGNNYYGQLGNGSSRKGQSIGIIFPPVQVICPDCGSTPQETPTTTKADHS